MRCTRLVGLTALLILLPATAMSSEIRVKAGNVEASTYSDGSVYVNMGKTFARVSPRRFSRHRFSRHRNPFYYWHLPWQSNCRNSSYQRTTQVMKSGSRVVQSNASSRTCH